MDATNTITITYGDQAEAHVGMKKNGSMAESGLSIDDVPLTNKVRISLPIYFGDKVKDMKAEGNYYYDKKKCGIGYHGDAERKITIGARLGATMPMCYQWFYKGKAVGKNLRIEIPSGAIYAMSQKAAGCDWKRRSILTLRHSAGCDYYTKVVDSKKW